MREKIKLEKPTEYQNVLARYFAKESADSSYDEYLKRNQPDKKKHIRDIYIGKLAEYMVYNYYQNKDINVTPPDIMIYDKKKKSYDADLAIINDSQIVTKIHVKSHITNNLTDVSWVFQRNTDPLINNPLPNDYLALCVFDEIKKEYYMYIVNIFDVKFSEMVLEHLRNNKIAIYESTL